MNKQLSDYFRLLLDQRENLLGDYYEDYALMMSDEAVVIGGLLVGLNILDCNLCLKEEDLDSNDFIIDLTMYLRDNIQEDSIKELIADKNVTDHWYVTSYCVNQPLIYSSLVILTIVPMKRFYLFWTKKVISKNLIGIWGQRFLGNLIL